MAGPSFYEFFAGGGMARAGLGPAWTCLAANDFDAKKRASYETNWGEGAFRLGDIHALRAADLPGQADLAWASFPCQDLSLAGAKAGLAGARSGAFYGFRDIVAGLAREGRAPRLLALENVVGALTSHGGRDFAALCGALGELGYVFGAMVMDAADFTPQSRPRLFIVAARRDMPIPAGLVAAKPLAHLASPALLRAHGALEPRLAADWRWWRVPAPVRANVRLIDVVEDEPADTPWHTGAQTQRLIALMSDANRAKLDDALASGQRRVGALYRRTRTDASGVKAQRAEVRFDGLAGCLRTPGGGSSRQFLVIVEGGRARTRLLSGREAARLMGLPDDYILPARYTDAYHLLGDGVAPPVVRHIAENLLAPLVARSACPAAA
jgi:DNA (cytosine-5)-methyltransferase 1